jgi:hypothetical protein
LERRRWVWVPARPAPLLERRQPTTAGSQQGISMPRAAPRPVDQVTPVDLDPDPVGPDRVVTAPRDQAPADRAGLVAPAPGCTAPAGQADLAGLVAPAPGCTGQADLAGLVAPAPGCTALADLAVAAAHGMATTSAATSTAHRGATDPHPGALVHHPGRTGTDRSHRPGGSGGMAPSTTGATRKTRCGIPSSTSGASTSSESGSRCNESPHTTPASPIGEAGVVLIRLTAHPAAAQHTSR